MNVEQVMEAQSFKAYQKALAMLLTRVLGSLRLEIGKGPGKNFMQGFTGAPAIAGERENKQYIPLLAHFLRRGAGSLYGMGAWFRRQTREVLRWFAHLIGSVACRVPVCCCCF